MARDHFVSIVLILDNPPNKFTYFYRLKRNVLYISRLFFWFRFARMSVPAWINSFNPRIIPISRAHKETVLLCL